MSSYFRRMWTEDDGVLAFEWILLVTLLTVGIVSGVAGARDAIIDEFGDVAQMMLTLDQTYTIDYPLSVEVHDSTSSSSSNSSFTDDFSFQDCGRTSDPDGQTDSDQLLDDE